MREVARDFYGVAPEITLQEAGRLVLKLLLVTPAFLSTPLGPISLRIMLKLPAVLAFDDVQRQTRDRGTKLPE